jgi:hypothetical protein
MVMMALWMKKEREKMPKTTLVSAGLASSEGISGLRVSPYELALTAADTNANPITTRKQRTPTVVSFESHLTFGRLERGSTTVSTIMEKKTCPLSPSTASHTVGYLVSFAAKQKPPWSGGYATRCASTVRMYACMATAAPSTTTLPLRKQTHLAVRPRCACAKSANSADSSAMSESACNRISPQVCSASTPLTMLRRRASSHPAAWKVYGITSRVEPIIVFHSVKMSSRDPVLPPLLARLAGAAAPTDDEAVPTSDNTKASRGLTTWVLEEDEPLA